MFENDQYIYFLDNDEEETCEYIYLKNRFVSQCNPSNQKELSYYLKYARIYCNKKILKCKYSDAIETSLKSIVKTKKMLI